MGVGGGILLIALGAILAFAVQVEVDVIDLQTTGWVLMLSGATVLVLTLWFWHSRRQRNRPPPIPEPEMSVLEETRIAHSHAIFDPEPPGSIPRPPPEP
jgi:uncharacterized membrane protein YbhN (UPF0104 family)